jgi:hypothetical protein
VSRNLQLFDPDTHAVAVGDARSNVVDKQQRQRIRRARAQRKKLLDSIGWWQTPPKPIPAILRESA